MDTLLKNCEKEIQENLTKLNSITEAYGELLNTIKRIKETSNGFVIPSTLEELITVLLQQTTANLKNKDFIPTSAICDNGLQSVADENVAATSQLVNGCQDVALDEKTENILLTDVSSLQDRPQADLKEDQLIVEQLLRTSGGKKGVKYQVEVTSSLEKDGSFWSCNVEAGFIQDKLEPFSKLLKRSTHDRELWVVNNDDLVCCKSSAYCLWMRGKIVKEINVDKVRIRYVDVGNTEDVSRSFLTKVPQQLAEIPFMAFHCRFFEENLVLDYDAKWRFSDLTLKKILNFTVENMVDVKNSIYLIGKLETILDDPKINISEEIKKYAKSQSQSTDQEISVSRMTRDVRTQDAANTVGFVTKSEVIRNSGSQQQPAAKIDKEIPKALEIPTSEILNSTPVEPKLNWGDCATPGADEEFDLPPLDEHLFDTPSHSHDEEQLREKLRQDKEEYETSMKIQTVDQSDCAVKNLADSFQTISLKADTQPQDKLISCVQPQLESEPHLHTHLESLKQQELASSINQISSSKPITHFCFPMQPISLHNQSNASQGNISNTNMFPISSTSDFLAKLQQLDAINRCLQMPGLDAKKNKELLEKKFILQQELNSGEQQRINLQYQLQQHQLLLQQQLAMQQLQNKQCSTNHKNQETVDQQSANQNQFGQQHFQQQLQMPNQQNECYNPLLQQTALNLISDPQSLSSTQQPNDAETLKELNKVPDVDSSIVVQDTVSKVPLNHLPNQNVAQEKNIISDKYNFITPSFENLSRESADMFTSREIHNLNHPLFDHPKVRFFTVMCTRYPQKYVPNLIHVYKNGSFWLSNYDAEIFIEEWKKSDGPIFLLIKHKPYESNGDWKNGGICRVMSDVRSYLPNRVSHERKTKTPLTYECRIQFVSTAMLKEKFHMKSHKQTREMPREFVKVFLKNLLSDLSEGRSESLFRYQYNASSLPSSNQSNVQIEQYTTNNSTDHLDTKTWSPLVSVQSENWEDEIGSNTSHNDSKKSLVSIDYGSGDECESSMKDDFEVFRVNQDEVET